MVSLEGVDSSRSYSLASTILLQSVEGNRSPVRRLCHAMLHRVLPARGGWAGGRGCSRRVGGDVVAVHAISLHHLACFPRAPARVAGNIARRGCGINRGGARGEGGRTRRAPVAAYDVRNRRMYEPKRGAERGGEENSLGREGVEGRCNNGNECADSAEWRPFT